MVTVYMHWGREYATRPNRRQQRIAEHLHSLGVSFVIGTHSHTLQGHSKTAQHFTAYSIGNFLFPRHGTPMKVSGLLSASLPSQANCPLLFMGYSWTYFSTLWHRERKKMNNGVAVGNFEDPLRI